ncbi:hypothetical protein ACFOOK_19795 [Micromonospora krabiensis]|uniref:Uncharacterized protein n=1 Tax=Micromonospora krabiensis TaxID=307121 RepID=A0A1C3N9C3_9ACTN|nr:hypothetical protein [Micromonospora krabiensis]SBV29182.1 hypothetical protein GA0070620_4752 [Micromonospora krabiensis]
MSGDTRTSTAGAAARDGRPGPSGPGRQRTPGNRESAPPAATPEAALAAWQDYLAAARQLDGVRRAAASAAGEQARSVQAAREELTEVRTQLAVQQARLRERGVPAISLVPSPPELTEATRSMAGGPATVLAALRVARGRADAADAALVARHPLRPASWAARPRNLLVYGPLALVVPVIQVLVYVATGPGPASVAALICGLPMPAVAFVAGWVGVGRLFRGRPGGRPDRTSRFGALVCLVPAVLVTAGLLLALLSG